MVTQRRPLVLTPEQPARLKLRHDQVDEVDQRAGEVWGKNVETVRGFLDEPFLQRIGDALGGPAEDPVTAGRRREVVEIAQGHVLPAREFVEDTRESLAARVSRRSRHRRVERKAGHVVADPAGHQGEGVGRREPALELGELVAGLRLGASDDRHHAGQHRDLIRRAAILRHAPLQVAIGTPRGRQLLDDGEHDVGRPRGQLEPGLRAAGLDDDRMTLGATSHVDGALHLEEPATMVQRADLRRVDEDPGRLVRDDRAVLPADPEALDDVDELLGDLVTQVVLHVGFTAEVERGFACRARHHVPGRPAPGDVVDRAEGAGDVVGLAEAGRHGGAEADVPRRGAQRRDERGRLEPAEK